MGDSSKDVFDGAAAIFYEHVKTLRGYIRYELCHRNLVPYVKGQDGLTILDIGGGSGIDAAWLALMGHKVTLVEPSAVQFGYAETRFNYFLTHEQRQCINLVKGTIDDLPHDARFDIVLLHGVAAFLPYPTAFIGQALQRVKSNGIISIMEKGYYGAETLAIRERNVQHQQMLKAEQKVPNQLGIVTYTFKPEEIESLLTEQDFSVIDWSGVRVIVDDNTLLVSDVDADELEAIIEAESEQGRDPRIRARGQLLHFIARKN